MAERNEKNEEHKGLGGCEGRAEAKDRAGGVRRSERKSDRGVLRRRESEDGKREKEREQV